LNLPQTPVGAKHSVGAIRESPLRCLEYCTGVLAKPMPSGLMAIRPYGMRGSDHGSVRKKTAVINN